MANDSSPPAHSQGAPAGPMPVPAEKARQGRIVLRTRGQRLIFIFGLAGIVLFPFILLALVGWS